MKIKIIIIPLLILGIAFGAYKYLTQNKGPFYDFAVVEKGDIVQKVSVTGQVVPAQTIDLQFEIQGKIKQIKRQVGENVEAGDVLAILDTAKLNTQVLEAQASRDIAQAKLDQLLTGVSEQEIKVYETAVRNAEIGLQSTQVAFQNAQQNLSDVQAIAQENLSQAYDDAMDTLKGAYLKAYNASNAVVSIYRGYFQISTLIKNDKESIKDIASQSQVRLNEVKANPSNKNIDKALSDFEQYLTEISSALENIRTTIEESIYFYTVSDADKTVLDNQKSYVNAGLVSIECAQQTIASTELTNESNINAARSILDAAQSQVYEAEGSLQSAKDKLVQIKAPPQKADLALAQAQLDQAEAVLVKTRQELDKASLVASCNGIIANIMKEEGEMVRTMTADPAIALICKGEFQIEVDIPEVDVAKIKIQDAAEIILDAFSEYQFAGKIIEIDPAETIIQGVVYYKVTVSFVKSEQGIKSGMTANVDIITEAKKNVLIIPQRAVLTNNGQKYVRILQGEEIKEVGIETGIRGNLGEIEIVSGLEQGDKIITFVKSR